MRNIEIKSPLDDRDAIEARLASLGARRADLLRQRDTFFGVPRGWLKLREFGGDAPAELISYVRATDTGDARPSDYDVQALEDPGDWHRLLGRVLPVEGVVEKERTLWLWRHSRIHLDRVRGLGDFLEIETVLDGIDESTGETEAGALIDALGLARSRFLNVPYRDLLRAKGEEGEAC